MISTYGSNVTGDLCAFPDEQAAKLIANGVAEAVVTKKEPEETKAPEEAPRDKMVAPGKKAGRLAPTRK
jgi:hypothetical protein